MANNAKHPQITLLLTRPLTGGDPLWLALSDVTRDAVTPISCPLMRIDALDVNLPDVTNAVFTSVNGPRFGPAGRKRAAFCVGEQTAHAAHENGWIIQHCNETADDLVEHTLQHRPSGPLTHLSGTHTRGNVAQRLTAGGVPTRQIAIYDQVLLPLSGDAQQALRRENPVIVPLFSPRAARQFAKMYKGHALLHIVALSPAIANEVQGLSVESLHVCPHPTRTDMVETVENVAATLCLG